MDTTTQASVPTSTSAAPAFFVRQIDSKSAIAIINKRTTVTPADAGSDLKLTVQGSGQFLAKGHKYQVAGEDRENMFDRTIYNLRASSALLMAFHKPLFTAAMKAEGAGEMDKAHDLFNEYLNAIQLSFSVIEPSSRRFHNGDSVKATVQLVVSLAGNQSVQVDNVSYIAPVVKAATKFDVTDLIEA